MKFLGFKKLALAATVSFVQTWSPCLWPRKKYEDRLFEAKRKLINKQFQEIKTMKISIFTKTILSGVIFLGVTSTGFAAQAQENSSLKPSKAASAVTGGMGGFGMPGMGMSCGLGGMGCFNPVFMPMSPNSLEQHCSFGFEKKTYGVGRSKEYSVDAKLFNGKSQEGGVSGITFSGKPGLDYSATKNLGYTKSILYTEEYGVPMTIPEPDFVTTGIELAVMLDRANPKHVNYCVVEKDLLKIKKLKHGLKYPVVSKVLDTRGDTTVDNGEKTVSLGNNFFLKIKVTPANK